MRRPTLVVLALFWVSHGAAVPAQPVAGPDPLFEDDAILEARLSGPLFRLIDEKSKEDYLDGKFSVVDAAGETLEFDVRFRARGNFRHDNCDYPPVRLNFRKSQTKDTLFDKQDKLKLVIHCNRRAEYQQIVLQEYLAYKVLNLLTDLSLRVRLLQIVYADPGQDFASPPRYAFLIEHKKRAGKRIGMEAVVTTGTRVEELDGAQLNLTSVFQYLIGNTDFSPIAAAPGDDCCHNYILFRKNAAKITPIPYDFDQSGFVDAPYAVPNPNFRMRTVRQRLYRGRCVNNRHVGESLQRLRDRREDIEAMLNAQPGLEEGARQDLVRFVDEFYAIAADPGRVERLILKRCI